MSELMSLRWDTGTAGDRVASPESGHLAVALPKDGRPLLVHWGFSPTHTPYKITVHQWSSLTKELTTCFVLRAPGEKTKRGSDRTLVGNV